MIILHLRCAHTRTILENTYASELLTISYCRVTTTFDEAKAKREKAKRELKFYMRVHTRILQHHM